jgi:hypothetical protein
MDRLEKSGVGDRVILKSILVGWESVHCIHRALVSNQFRVFVNTVMNRRVPPNEEHFLTR